ncbi:cellulose binding domain-containing protein [Actinoplanes palleronii]|uniref:Alpha-L-arabinofuranosidase n=1 Tax=Actinoplanes palleronii TaxID=113570 RepID=A0ABQ4BQH7_9ACTN|nr:cellulose binding domain-containing protein [Actinoplanes palleronii]GIE72551.1 alpha-L-arabinofuranosidase [Actinoplanes palleronii]
MPSTFLRRTMASTVLLAMTAAVAAAAPPGAQAAAPATTHVDVDVRAGLATVGDAALGINHAIWDSQLGTPAVADLLHDAGVTMLRYPGGSYADIYHWRDHTAPGGYVAPNTDFDTFMAGARRTGAEPMIIANYGTGTAQEAADWVRYANVTKGYGARYWTVGNENYGNGHYGSAWEADEHADKSPAEYASNVIAYSQAMKAVDPTIKVGAVLTMPGNWPDGIVGTGDQGTWNTEVLSRAGAAIDFVDVHWYPGGATPAETLTKPAQIQDATFLLRQQINQYAGANASRIQISMTETNVDTGRTTQPGALFLADVYSGLLAQGVFTVQWWNVHNGIDKVSTVAGKTDYGDYGLLSSGNCTADGTTCEPPLNTPFAPYHALSLVGSFARPGDRFVAAGADDPLVSAHAVRRTNGDLAVLLINKDPDASHTVALNYQGFTPSSATPAVATFADGADAVTTGATGTAAAQTLTPYSITLVTLHPNRTEAGGPSAPARPTATVTDRTATISWPAVAAGVKYEVYRQNGGAAELLGETTGTSLTVRNLDPGRRYTVNVLARDSAGRQSPPSPPLTFTTGTPAGAACTVKLRDTNDWGNGFVASVDITNNTASALTGWTLTFTWPTGWQTMNGGWSATWEQNGRTVRAVGDALAAGATASAGFVGGYSGPNVLPTVFTLNGTVCTTG